MSNEQNISKCELCGEPMPHGEQMFKYHGYSGPCPKPPMQPFEPEPNLEAQIKQLTAQNAALLAACKIADEALCAATCGHAKEKTLNYAIDKIRAAITNQGAKR